ncbi:MAG: hypothetical protein Kow00127_23200 [Bacteroidales bacterium]
MRKAYLLISMGLFMLLHLTISAQVTIWSENFTYPNGTTQGSGTPPKWTLSVPAGANYFEVRSNRLEARNLGAEGVWYSEVIDISSYSNVSVTVDLSEGGNLENSDYIRSFYKLDGGAETMFSTNGEITNDFGSATASQTGLNGSTLEIVFRAMNNQGSERYRWDNVVVSGTLAAPPVADFVADNTNPEIGQTVTFTDLSSGSPTSWSWSISPSTYSFTGGTSASSQNPQVQFSAAGSYTVSLVATNSYGSDTEVKIDYIFVNPPSLLMSNGSTTTCWANFYDSGGPTANYSNNESFTYTIYPAYAGNMVQVEFTTFDVPMLLGIFADDILSVYDGVNTSAPLIGEYYGANAPGTIHASNPAGALTFVFTSGFLTNGAGWEASISCLPPTPPVADFTADLTVAGVNQTVTFQDLSANIPTSWNWSITPATFTFVGGTGANSQNPQVQFSATGFYTVSLTVTNAGGSDIITKTNFIEVVDCTVTSLPWSEDFNTGGVLPTCWANIDNIGGGEVWRFDNPGAKTVNTTTATNGFAIFDSDYYGFGSGPEDADLVSPVFDLSSVTQLFVQFEHYFQSGFSGAAQFDVSINNGASWTTVDSWSGTSTTNPAVETYDLSTLVAGYSQVVFRWKWTGNWSWYWAVDDIVVTDQAIAGGQWTGVINTDWNNPGNWSDGIVPGVATNVEIGAGAPNYPVINSNSECKSLTIHDGGRITVVAGGNLTVLGHLTNGDGTSGEFIMNGGMCHVSGDYYSAIGSTTTITGGEWNFYNWYQNSTTPWSKGYITLSGGVINATGSVVWSNYDVFGTIDGPVTLNIGGTFRNNSDDWTMTDGTVVLLGTDGPGPHYFMASTWGAGNYIAAYNLIVNAPEGVEYITNPPSDVTGVQILNNLTVETGLLTTDDGGGFMNDDFTIGGSFVIGVRGKMTADVTGTFSVAGDLLFQADHNNSASFVDNGHTSVSGTSNVEQYLASERWHLVSPPVSGATINTFLNIYLKEYNEPTNTWTYLITPTTIPMNPSQGYAAWASDALTGPVTVNYQGTLNTGDFSLSTLSYTPASPKVGWNLVGNPYPSMLVWNSNWTKTDLFEWACVHQGGNDGCYNAATSEVWPVEGGPMTNGNIPAGQGFWVRASSGAAALTIPQSERVHDNQTIYKSSQSVIYQAVRLKVEGNNDRDYVWVDFTPEATPAADPKFDLQKRWGYDESPNIYAVGEDGEQYSVHTLPFAEPGLVVPLGYVVGVPGTFSLSVSELRGMEDAGLTVVLEDLATGEFVTLTDETVYQFEATPDDDPHRFNLHFQDAMTGVEPLNLKPAMIYTYDHSIYLNSGDGHVTHVAVFDLLGKKVFEQSLGGDSRYRIPFRGEPGYYVVQSVMNNNIVTEKVMIK